MMAQNLLLLCSMEEDIYILLMTRCQITFIGK